MLGIGLLGISSTKESDMSKTLDKAEELLKELAKDKDRGVRMEVAMNTNTPPAVLKELAKDKNRGVRMEVAFNPNTPIEALKELAKDKDEGVRYWVAKNPNTFVKMLKELAKDKVRDVREGVAENPSTPVGALAKGHPKWYRLPGKEYNFRHALMAVPGGVVLRTIETDDPAPVAVAMVFIPGATLQDFGVVEEHE